jgi:N-acetylmuramoyl-L-alanine amidase
MTKLPDPLKPIEEQDEDIILAMCLWAEGRGECQEAQEGIANVILNRARHPRWWGHDVKSVVLAKWQFSSFNKDNPATPKNEEDPNRHKLLCPTKDGHGTQAEWDRAYTVAACALSGSMTDNTDGSTHYYDISIAAPGWTRVGMLVKQIGGIRFYKNIP